MRPKSKQLTEIRCRKKAPHDALHTTPRHKAVVHSGNENDLVEMIVLTEDGCQEICLFPVLNDHL